MARGRKIFQDPVLITNLNELERGEVFRQKLLQHPSIADVSLSSSSPVSDYNHHYGTSFRLPGQPEETGKGAEEKGADMESRLGKRCRQCLRLPQTFKRIDRIVSYCTTYPPSVLPGAESFSHIDGELILITSILRYNPH